MRLNELSSAPNAHKKRMRVGRGIGSGKGKTCGRGQKGQKSRTGVSLNGFEGGQTALFRRLPKRGFNNPFRKEYVALNTGQLQIFINEGKIDAKKLITKDILYESGLVSKKDLLIKLLGKGELKDSVQLEVDRASASAIELVEKAKGTVRCLKTINAKEQ